MQRKKNIQKREKKYYIYITKIMFTSVIIACFSSPRKICDICFKKDV